MRDLYNQLTIRRAISPGVAVTDNTAFVSQIIDRQGFDSLVFAINTGSLADANATFTVLIEDGDAANLSDNAAVVDAELNGTEALAGFQFDDDNETRKIGYIGNKRYVRMTITPAGNTGDIYLSAVAILSHASLQPNGA